MNIPNVFKKALLAGAAFLLVSGSALAQEDALKGYPGYVDFGELVEIFGEPTVQIAVGESLLGLVGSLSAKEDPEAAALFKRLQGVRVNVFEDTDGLAEGIDYVKSVSQKLSGAGWESVVSVNSADEQVRIFMMINGDRVEGITVMAVEETEAVFVNVIGDLNPEELERVMDNFDVELD
ncbi:MAG: DUF4252 domain-containing protein [Xanthomonadales bacterium]|nr:DUF4252 domain-containing protein [Gammaproteobacteria bacterium]MBT8051391.1 DUF4252 domain-containing protein [Gammaproteobacteria bacterium]MBT8056907.1 DUF4252 domain-containing protein [Gammaproteobacteria bacterium]NNJ78902.1 DUF4252 domain-containing protein [Xanthomonadales bacterium]NNL05927.1 DUF4252 domain-containing protein [Xanthomonadales bacterium]